LAAYRIAALAYAVILIGKDAPDYRHETAAWVVAVVLTAWTAATILLYRRPSARRWPLLTADLVVLVACVLVSRWVIGTTIPRTHTLPSIAAAGAVLAWAIADGRRGALISATLLGAADLSTRGEITQNAVHSDVLLLLAATAIGYVAQLGAVAYQRLAQAARIEAATRTKQRLARDIHDSVLQVLALVARRAESLGGEAGDLARLAGEQEVALRHLISTAEPVGDAHDHARTDLRPALQRFASASVTVAAPGTEVGLPIHMRDEIVAAVGSALENVSRHAGPQARAWVLLEDETTNVTITVRDDGTGFPDARLAEAEAQGRLGIAQSIRGRVADLGGTVLIHSTPGEGTEVELRVPRPRGV